MDVITLGFLGLSQNIHFRMKKLCPCVKKRPRDIFPRAIMHAAWVSNTIWIIVKKCESQGIIQKIKYTKSSNLQNSAALKKNDNNWDFLRYFSLL